VLLLLGGIDNRRCAKALHTVSPGSPLPVIAAYTYLKEHRQPLQVVTLSQSLFFLLLHSPYLPKTATAFAALANLPSEVLTLQKPSLAGKTFPSPKLKPPPL
jgi:hypothetical protein